MTSPSAPPPPPLKRKRPASPTKVLCAESGSSKVTATEGDETLDPAQQRAAPPPTRVSFPVILDGGEEEEEEENSLVPRSRRRKTNPTSSSPDPHAGVTPSKGTPESVGRDQAGFGPEAPTLNFVPNEIIQVRGNTIPPPYLFLGCQTSDLSNPQPGNKAGSSAQGEDPCSDRRFNCRHHSTVSSKSSAGGSPCSRSHLFFSQQQGSS